MNCEGVHKIRTLLAPTDSIFTQHVEAKLVAVDKVVANEAGSSA
jgi:hypothetical protein